MPLMKDLDWDRIDFGGHVEEVALRTYNAGFAGARGDKERYLASLWQEYTVAGRPEPVRRWVVHRLRGEFLCVDKPPVWVGAEPNWAFHDGRPMVFMYQTPHLPQNEVTEKHLSWGGVLYVFGIRVPHPRGGFQIVYKMIEECPGMRGTNGVQSNPIWLGGEPPPST